MASGPIEETGSICMKTVKIKGWRLETFHRYLRALLDLGDEGDPSPVFHMLIADGLGRNIPHYAT